MPVFTAELNFISLLFKIFCLFLVLFGFAGPSQMEMLAASCTAPINLMMLILFAYYLWKYVIVYDIGWCHPIR